MSELAVHDPSTTTSTSGEEAREALALADGTPYGPAAVVLTPDMDHAQRGVRELRVGTVRVLHVEAPTRR